MRRACELVVLAGILALGAWLRLRRLELMEFKLDEANAVELARRLLHGTLPSVGLTSSVGAANPPLFAYVEAIPLAVWDDPLAATGFIGLFAVVAIALTYVIARPRFGALAALTAAALFATAPWAVLAGRKIWAQNMLPPVTVGLLWSLFLVLERRRTRVAALVPVLLCLAFQLNFSALALVLPAAVVLAYRAREVSWPAVAAGVCAAIALLSPWLVHEWRNGFSDLEKLATEGRSGSGSSTPGAATVEAFRQTVHLTGAMNWGYVTGVSRSLFASDAGAAWTLGRAASFVVAGLLVVGLATCALGAVRGARRVAGWPWFEFSPDASRRALMLVWLAALWLAYAASATGRVFPHYLLGSYPVSFMVAAVGLADLTAATRARAAGAAAAAGLVVALAVAYATFTVTFHDFVERNGGTAGDYGSVYRDKSALAAVMRVGAFRAPDEPVIDFLARDLDAPPAEPPFVTVRDWLESNTPLPCDGRRRWFGQLEACFPPPIA